jgi:CheY-like chemotaxis protein
MARPTNALIVDDEAHVRLFARLLLKDVGITNVWEASDGQQAVELLNTHEPQLLLLDVNMPVMGGLDLLRELQAAGWNTPVIMLTAESSVKTVQQAAALGAAGYLLKQSSREESVAALREILDEVAEGETDASGPAASSTS